MFFCERSDVPTIVLGQRGSIYIRTSLVRHTRIEADGVIPRLMGERYGGRNPL